MFLKEMPTLFTCESVGRKTAGNSGTAKSQVSKRDIRLYTLLFFQGVSLRSQSKLL